MDPFGPAFVMEYNNEPLAVLPLLGASLAVLGLCGSGNLFLHQLLLKRKRMQVGELLSP